MPCATDLEQAYRVLVITVRTYQRWTASGTVQSDRRPESLRPTPRNKLSTEERARVLSLCHDPAYASLPPGQIVPRLADQGVYIASEASFYRILHTTQKQHHRGRSRRPGMSTPRKGYCARAPNQVWSWDITYLPTRVRGMLFYLYMIVDVFSRKIVGWKVQLGESGFHAAVLVQKAILSEGCLLEPPVLLSDNGSAQKGFTLRAKLENLGVTASYSRPHISEDNPYSEAFFRTVKYRPDYPSQGFDFQNKEFRDRYIYTIASNYTPEAVQTHFQQKKAYHHALEGALRRLFQVQSWNQLQ